MIDAICTFEDAESYARLAAEAIAHGFYHEEEGRIVPHVSCFCPKCESRRREKILPKVTMQGLMDINKTNLSPSEFQEQVMPCVHCGGVGENHNPQCITRIPF